MRFSKFIITLFIMLLVVSVALAVSPTVRIKDISHILEARENQLMGFGLVIGLSRTGDTSQTGFTKQALTNLLGRMGVVPQANVPDNTDFKSKNVAAVMVTANLPPFVKTGQHIDVTVSSLGDATSLQGGTLLLTPLEGSNGDVYAVAQGPVSVGGALKGNQISFNPNPTIDKQNLTVGLVPRGALIEKEVPVSIGNIKDSLSVQIMEEKGIKVIDEDDGAQRMSFLTIVLNNPDFTTASRVAYSIVRDGIDARAKDAATVLVPINTDEDIVAMISKIENLKVVPDLIAKIVINERTGTVVIGENVRIAPVAVAFGNVSVQVGDIDMYSYTSTDDNDNTTISKSKIKADETKNKLIELSKTGTLRDLVKTLNSLGASPKDLITIIQTIKASGALTGEIEII